MYRSGLKMTTIFINFSLFTTLFRPFLSGPESVKEGQLVSEAVARNQEEAVNRRDLERNNNIDDDGKGSVAVRYNEASIVAPDYEDEEEDCAKVAHRSEVENSDDISPENSAIDSSDVDDDENGKQGNKMLQKNGKNGVNSVSSVSSIIEAQASDSSTISSREKNLTTECFFN